MSRRFCSIERADLSVRHSAGVILIDILLALTLAGTLIAIFGGSAEMTRRIFREAKQKSALLDGQPNADSPPQVMGGNSYCVSDYFRSNPVGSFFRSAGKKVSIRQIFLPINPSIPLTDIAVSNGIAFVSADSSSAAEADLFVFDVSDPANPVLLSLLNTGPGIAAIALSGRRVYAAAASMAAQLHVIYFDAPDRPVLEKKYQLPLPYATATAPFGTAIAHDDGYVYLGTERWDGEEFSVINVRTPAVPDRMGGFETGSKVNGIALSGNNANKMSYIAASDPIQMRIVDLGNPAYPRLIGAFSPSGGERQEGNVVNLFQGGVSLGRTSGGFDIRADHELFSFASTSSTTLGRYVSTNLRGGVYGLVEDKFHAFAATREPNRELVVFGRSPNGETDFSSSTVFSLPVAPQALVCDMGRLYVLSHTSPVIYEVSFIDET